MSIREDIETMASQDMEQELKDRKLALVESHIAQTEGTIQAAQVALSELHTMRQELSPSVTIPVEGTPTGEQEVPVNAE